MDTYELPEEVLMGSDLHPEGKIYFHRLEPDSAWRGTIKSQCGNYFDNLDIRTDEHILERKSWYVPCSRNGCFPGWWRTW